MAIQKENILLLAETLNLPPEVLPPLSAAADTLPPDLPIPALTSPQTAGSAWKETAARLPAWEEDDGMAQLAAVLAAACETQKIYRQAGISEEIFLSTMGCLSRFLAETKEITGRWAFDRGFWTWRQTGCLLFRLGELEYEYAPAERGPCPRIQPGDPALHVHIPSDAVLTRERLDASYAQAWRFYSAEGAPFCGNGPPKTMVCDSWLLAPALDELLPETSGIRQFAGDYERIRINGENTSFYRWLFRKAVPAPLEELPEDTSLQRAVKVRLAAGGNVGSAWGALREELHPLLPAGPEKG